MTFTVAEGVQLVAWMVLVFWEPYMPGKKSRAWYNEWRTKVPWIFSPPSWVFPPVWFCLKSLVTASVFLYFKFVAEQNPAPTEWQYLAVYITFLVNILMAKAWSPLFFGGRMMGLALVNAFWIWATAVLVLVFMGLSASLMASDIWFVPLVLYILYPVWLTYAFLINLAWWRRFEMSMDGVFGFKLRVPGVVLGLFSETPHHHHHHKNKKQHKGGKIHHKNAPSEAESERNLSF